VKIELDHLRPIHRVPKVYGEEWWLTNTDSYCAKILFLNAGFQSSLHRHEQKKEDFLILSGALTLEQRDVRGNPFEEFLSIGDKRTIEPNTLHRFSSKEGAVILEISTTHRESDVFRITESGPIECTPCKQKSPNS